jgi:hypothetical protein
MRRVFRKPDFNIFDNSALLHAPCTSSERSISMSFLPCLVAVGGVRDAPAPVLV